MKIIKYKKKSNGMYEIYLSNDEKIMLHEDVILKNNLLITKNINDDIMKKIIKDNDEASVYNTCIKYISFKMRYKNEVLNYLKKKNISNEIINEVIKKLEKEGYINDLKYAKLYIKDQLRLSNNGPIKIKNMLISYGIDANIINEEINSIKKDEVKEKLTKLVNKKTKLLNGSKKMIKSKLINYFNNLGYENSMINSVIDNMNIKTDINKLSKEYDLLYFKYKKKYNEDEVKYIVMNKLLMKGYTKEDIKRIDN